MGFTDDLWTALLSDDQAEYDEAIERIAEDEVATAIAEETFILPPSTDEEISTDGEIVTDEEIETN